MKKQQEQNHKWKDLPRHGFGVIIAGLLFSLVLHFYSGYKLATTPNHRLSSPFENRQKIKIKYVQKEKKDNQDPKDNDTKKILEVKQEKTEKPELADHVGHVDHKAEKETRVSKKVQRENAADPGVKGKKSNTPPKPSEQQASKTPPAAKETPTKEKKKKSPFLNQGTLAFDKLVPSARNKYEELLPRAMHDLSGQVNAGYQDYVDDDIAESDRIDINTTQYRYIGYFTNMRKAINLVWIYPREASMKGLQGEVGLEFAINKDGTTNRIKVIKSSGYSVLDEAIVDAIKLASPFAPLPDGFNKERIVVTGAFRYVLTSFGSH